MAQRRMYAKTIICSDAFLEMNPKSQCLYIQLNMNADDDGVINNTKSIMALTNSTKANYKELLDRKFIIELDGLTIIKHWKINNYIAKDRYTESKYQDTIKKLRIDENNAYTTNENVIQNVDKNVYKKDTQVSIDKISKEKNNNYILDLLNIYYKNKSIPDRDYTEINRLINEYGQEKVRQAMIQAITEKDNHTDLIDLIQIIERNNKNGN